MRMSLRTLLEAYALADWFCRKNGYGPVAADKFSVLLIKDHPNK